MKRVLLIVLGALAAGLGVVLLAAGVLLGTERGATWALRFAPEELSVERVEGRLLGPLVLRGVDYQSESLGVAVDSVRVEWRPTALTGGEVSIRALEAHGVDVWPRGTSDAVPEPESEREGVELPEVDLPMAVNLEGLRVTDLRWHASGAEVEPADDAFVVEEIVARGSAEESRFRITSLGVRTPEVRAELEGELTLADDYSHDLRFSWEADLPDTSLADASSASGRGGIRGDLGESRLHHRLSTPVEAEVSARLDEWSGDLRWRADLSVPRTALSALRSDLPPHRVGMELDASGSRDSVHVRSLALLPPEGAGRVGARGRVGLAGESPGFDLAVEWEDLRWPPAGDAAVTSPAGEVRVSGTPESYEAALRVRTGGTGLPPGAWRLTGRGTESGFRVTRLRGETLEGRVAGTGALSWDPHPAWDVRITAEDVNPAVMTPEWPGRLELRLLTRGGLPDGGPSVDLELMELDGELRGREVDGRAAVSLRGERLNLETVELRSGTAVITASGRAGDALDLAWRVDAEDLEDLGPGLRGSLSAEGSLSGPADAPAISARLSGSRIGLVGRDPGAEIRAGARRVDGRLRVDLSGRRDSEIDLRMQDVVANGARIAEAQLEGRGRPAEHRLGLSVAGESDRMRIAVGGSIVDPDRATRTWRGSLEELTLATERAGDWRLREPAQLAIASGRVSLETFCLAGRDAGEVCVRGARRADGGAEGRIRAEGLPLALADPLLPPDTELEGTVEAEIRGRRPAEGDPELEGRITAGPGRLAYVAGRGRRVERGYDSLGLRFRMDASELSGRLSLEMRDDDRLAGDVRMMLGPPSGERILEGRLAGRLDDRGLVGAHVDVLAATAGTLRVDLRAAGTAAEPRVSGTVRLQGASADVLPAGVRLEDVSFEARSASDGGGSGTWTLEGTARSGEGRATVDGSLRLPEEDGWTLDLAVRGDRFRALGTPLARVIATPDLRVRASAGGIDVAGEVRIPRADITPDRQQPVVSPSDDVVVLQRDTVPEADEPPLEMTSEVRVVLGDSVFLDGFGVAGRLGGSLVVVQSPGRPLLGRGEVQILEGEYTAYRQRLTIERGRLIFAGTPISNPGLDLRVVRRTGDVLAGLEIGGTARAPEAELFSEPPMAESDALAYLLLGRPTSGASREEGELLQNAATSAGLAGGQLLAARLGQTFGLEEARIERDEAAGEASLVLGTYVSPRLYIGYGIGLFEAVSVLTIRYELGEGWILQTESGLETGTDILYRFQP